VDKKEAKKAEKKQRITLLLIATAASILIAFSLQSDKGVAFMSVLKGIVSPDKEKILNIEGQDEKINVTLNEGKDAEYAISIDESRYKMIHNKDADLITPIEPLPEKYPKVSMEIKQVIGKKPKTVVKELETELKKDFPELRDVEEVTEPVEGFLLHGAAGNQADSIIVHAYVISNGKKGSFVITEHYFLEAAEGHGARFHDMLKSFEILTNKEDGLF